MTQLNVPLLQEIKAWLDAGAPHTHPKSQGTGFHMDTFYDDSHDINPCGTAMCIAGAAAAFSGQDVRAVDQVNRTQAQWESHSAALLGLDIHDAGYLFRAEFESEEFDWAEEIYFEDITPAMASKVIGHLIKTGKVDWSIVEGDLQ